VRWLRSLVRKTLIRTLSRLRTPQLESLIRDLVPRHVARLPADEALRAESAAQQTLVGQPNQLEAVMAGMQKRAPTFSD